MKHQTKEELVADYLREGIISGQFPRGSKLKQTEIAEMIGTSITPVREAIKLLEAEGFILGTSHRGAIVAPFDIDAAEEIVDLRVTLECKLALRAMDRLTSEQLQELRDLQEQLEAAASRGDRDAVRSINYRFHEVLYLAANLPQTLRFVRALWARYPFDLINKLENRVERASAEHREMLSAILTRDESAMLSALRTHIRAGWDEFKAGYSG
ncbi:DNA-binding GntR family transcriptional regulator [Rhodobium orientis]|uniref:GntR family transcriptional regulator n=1 Tax=Rhodobium orientis TaxID=34017 RepID=A0A327JJH7_9HYPH|nr:GntR family transcriptional regulator [Rhodobium orientis]MBB4303242.1 DNA-binding GntR family transcriptional regulator [Rhodobium orientis]MBK5951658.1 GntR family transcriptional regulator [Rhodobium orientis]RAI25866.1 GntR family transcriptional regulator [Rhodobium orientis]